MPVSRANHGDRPAQPAAACASPAVPACPEGGRAGWGLDVLLAGMILLAGIKLVWHLDRCADLDLTDESNFLNWGVHFFSHPNLPRPAWGGLLYWLWYWVLSLFTRDAVTLFYLNRSILTVLPAMLLYGALRTAAVRRSGAALFAFLFLISQVNLPLVPKVNHLMVCLILLALMLAPRLASPPRRLGVYALTALLCAYVHPEMYLAFLGLVAVLGGYAVRFRRTLDWRREGRWLGGGVLIALALHVWLGRPMFGGEFRSFDAFSQHFALNWVAWTPGRLSPWNDCQAIVQRNFGPVHTISEALRANPVMFKKHLAQNVKNYGVALTAMLYHLFWPRHLFILTTRAGVILLELVVFLYGMVLVRGGIRRGRILAQLKKDPVTLIAYGCFLAPLVMASIVIYPRQHYLLPQAVLLTCLLIGLLTGGQVLTPRRHAALGCLGLAALLLWVSPTARRFVFEPQDHLRAVRQLRALKLRGPANMLENSGVYTAYLVGTFHNIPGLTKALPFYAFLRQADIGLVEDSPGIREDSRFRDDPEWHDFLKDYGAHGFDRVKINGTKIDFLVRRDLLPQAPTLGARR